MLKSKEALWLGGSVGVLLVALQAAGCGDSFDSCLESRTCEAPNGGAAGESSESSTNPPGGGASDAGATSMDAQAGDASTNGGGGSDGPASSECPEGYSDWLTSSFAFPDGEVIGPADFPSMPWAKSGSLKIDTGRLSGAGVAVVSQGTAFPYQGSRLRFRTRFTDSNQEVTAALDAAKDGSGGARIEIDGYGRLSLSEGKTTVKFIDLPPLEAGIDWFVEGLFEAGSATVRVSRKNYASEKAADVVATLESADLKSSASGTKAVIALASNGGTSPAVDELSIARCGVKPPDYSEQLVDTFERPDSTVVGHAEIPATSSWTTSGTSERIVGGALLSEGLGGSTIPLKVSTAGLRIRTAIGMVDKAGFGLWADVNYNVAAGEHGTALPGFWIFSGAKNASMWMEVFGSLEHAIELPLANKAGTTTSWSSTVTMTSPY